MFSRNLARSIRDKAADMALGLVQLQRTDLTAAQAFVLQTPNVAESVSPRRRQRLTSLCATTKSGGLTSVVIRLDIVLDTPVLVMPRSSCSPHVFVAHLGKITVTNVRSSAVLVAGDASDETDDVARTPRTPVNAGAEAAADRCMFTIDEERCGSMFSMDDVSTPTADSAADVYVNHDFLRAFDEEADAEAAADLETYTIDVRNMNLFSLDTSSRKGFRMYVFAYVECLFYYCDD